MATNSLFGLTPEEANRMVGNEAVDRQMKLYGKDFAIGTDMGQGLLGLFGQQAYRADPRVQEAQQMQEVKQRIQGMNIDPQNLDEFYPAVIGELQKAGMIEKAMEMEKQYQTISVAREAAQARQRTAKEQSLEAKWPGYKLYNAFAKRKDVDWKKLEEFKKSISDENPGGNVELLRNADLSPDAQPKKVGVHKDTDQTVFADSTGRTFINQSLPDSQNPGSVVMARKYGEYPIRDESQKINVKMGEGDKAVLKAEADIFEKDLAKEGALVNAQSSLNKMAALVENGIVKGSFSDSRTAVLNALGTLGLNTGPVSKVLGNTQKFNIEAQKLVQSVIKQYGTNPSNADRLYAALSQPNANMEQVAEVLRSVKADAEKDLASVQSANEYFRANKTYGGFRRQARNYEAAAASNWQPIEQRSTEDLQRELAERRKGQ